MHLPGAQLMRAFISDDEQRKFIVNEDEDFVACFAYGQWHDHKMFDLAKLRELDVDDDFYEIAPMLRQAKKALLYM